MVAHDVDHVDTGKSLAVHLCQIWTPVGSVFLNIVNRVAGLYAEGICKLAAGDILDGRIEICGITALDIGKHKEIGRSLAVAGGGSKAECFRPLFSVAHLVIVGSGRAELGEHDLVQSGRGALGISVKGPEAVAAFNCLCISHVGLQRQPDYGIRLCLAAYRGKPSDALISVGVCNSVVLNAVGCAVVIGKRNIYRKSDIP